MRKLAAAASLAVALAGCGSPPVNRSPVPAAVRSPGAVPHSYLGVSVAGVPQSMGGVREFETVTGVHVNLVSYYTGWYENFDAAGTRAISGTGALPLIFLDSGRTPLTLIASGSDAWLTSYAAAIRAYGRPVAISFDSEVNGPWWPWSFEHESPAVFTAAWRRIVTIFRRAGASNVTWVWAVATSSPVTTALKSWWPGAGYVNWVGINGYYTVPYATFRSVFKATLDQVRRFTASPVLITETGASPASGRPRAITDLFAGAESTPGLLGFIWFDYDKNSAHGAPHNWFIDDDPPALAAFRAAAKEYR
jgi:mannan endo-1,4-beta-mannosidase